MNVEKLSQMESVEHCDRLEWLESCKYASELDDKRTIRATKFFGIDFETFSGDCEDIPSKLGNVNPDSVLGQCNAIGEQWVKSEVRLLGIRSPKKYSKTHERGGELSTRESRIVSIANLRS